MSTFTFKLTCSSICSSEQSETVVVISGIKALMCKMHSFSMLPSSSYIWTHESWLCCDRARRGRGWSISGDGRILKPNNIILFPFIRQSGVCMGGKRRERKFGKQLFHPQSLFHSLNSAICFWCIEEFTITTKSIQQITEQCS